MRTELTKQERTTDIWFDEKGRFSFRLITPYSEERQEAARRYARENNATERLK